MRFHKSKENNPPPLPCSDGERTLTWHEEAVVQHRHKVRVCVSVVHLLADEVENLRGTFGVYVYLEGGGHRDGSQSDTHTHTHFRQWRLPAFPAWSYRFKAFRQSQLVLVPQHLEVI